MSRFAVTELPLPGLKLVERQRLGDSRGFLTRMFCADELALAGWDKPIAQINHTLTTRKGAVRGMHYQHAPHAEMKLVNCIRGEVWDVVVDLRANSPTFLKWHAEVLSADNNRSLLIPEGCAHGFQALTEDVELIYFHSTAYHAAAEAGVNVRDSLLNIAWPLDITELSARDQSHEMLTTSFSGINIQ